jgi:hypothetical protein
MGFSDPETAPTISLREGIDYRGIQNALGAPARLCHRNSESRTPVAKRISGRGKPDPERSDQGTYDPIVAPAGIFPRHLHEQAFCFLIYLGAPYASTEFRPIKLRNHQGKDNRILFPSGSEARRNMGALRCRERLGGLLKCYEREAAQKSTGKRSQSAHISRMLGNSPGKRPRGPDLSSTCA